MKKKAVKTAVVFIEVVALVIAIAAASIFYLYWRTGQGPASLDLFAPSVEGAIENQLPEGYDADIQSINIQRRQQDGELSIRLSRLTIRDADGEIAAAAPDVYLTFAFQDLLRGEIGPRTAIADSARFRIVRRENLNVEIPIAAADKAGASLPVLSAFFDSRFLKSAFETARMDNTEIIFHDAVSGRSWSTQNAKVAVEKNNEDIIAHASGVLDMDGATASLNADAVYLRSSDIVDVDIKGENFPIGDLLRTFYGDRASIVDAPVSGEARISFTPDGDVLSSRFEAEIGAGDLQLGNINQTISTISWATSFDPTRNRFSIERLNFDVEGARGALNGAVAISFGEDIRKPSVISFDLDAEEIEVRAPEWFENDLVFERNAFVGNYNIRERRLNFDNLAAAFAGLQASGSLIFEAPRAANGEDAPSPGVYANLSFEGALTPESLLSIWPTKNVANGARDWIESRLAAAHIDNLNFMMNLTPGAVGENGGLPDEAMELTFDARDVTAFYVPQMTPLRAGAGSGVLRGNSFSLNVKRAQVGDIVITDGEVSFPEFMPKWRPTYYRFTAEGNAEAILAVLDEDPLSLLSKLNLSPAQFSGDATAQVEIMRPNKREVAIQEYGYSGIARFESMDISQLPGEFQFSDANGKVELKTRSLTVTADALLADAPINVKWMQNFYREDGPSEIEITGKLASTTSDLFGASMRRFVRNGDVYFKANALGELGAFETLNVETDFTEAVMSIEMLDWRKPAGAPAHGNLKMRFTDDGVLVDVLNFDAEDNAQIDGRLSFNNKGVLQTASIDRLSLSGAADLTVHAERDPSGVLGFTVVGPFLNAGPLIEQVLTGSGDNENETSIWGAGVALNARIDRITARNGVEYLDGALDLRRNADNLRALDFTAFDKNGTPLQAAMSLTGAPDGPQRSIEAQSSALGNLLSGVFGVRSVKDGQGVLRLMIDNENGANGFSGELEARKLQVVNAPLLARILSAGSLDGLANLVSGEGIEFDYAAGGFEYADGVLEIDDMQATGSSVGITTDGALSFGQSGQARLSGAVAPLYQLNSVLGNAPIIGDLLVGKKGEGIVAFSYTVGGDIANPQVVVNPLSALTPGIFRRLMQPPAPPLEEADPSTEVEPSVSKDE
ncbi:AsmA-like C-terminal domain-containing protein [Hyphococcus sp.]|uniref:YhdP family protein n=1 Tax=Hyphococcus sp. TaxID=2038636 RepID=UPI003CCB9A43